jgi:hypothetical protein
MRYISPFCKQQLMLVKAHTTRWPRSHQACFLIGYLEESAASATVVPAL